MKLRVIITYFLIVFCATAFAQSGNYFLSNYTPTDERIDYLTFGLTQDKNGVIYFANKSNILQFDGRNWTPIPTPGPVYTIAASENEVFAGGLKGTSALGKCSGQGG